MLAEGAGDHLAEPLFADIRDSDTLGAGAAARVHAAKPVDARLRAVDQRETAVGERGAAEHVVRRDAVLDQPVPARQPARQGVHLVQPRPPVALLLRGPLPPQEEVEAGTRLPEPVQEEPGNGGDGAALRDRVGVDRGQRETRAQMHHLQQGLPQQEQHQGASENAHGRETVQVRGVRQGVQAEGTLDKAPTNSQEDRQGLEGIVLFGASSLFVFLPAPPPLLLLLTHRSSTRIEFTSSRDLGEFYVDTDAVEQLRR